MTLKIFRLFLLFACAAPAAAQSPVWDLALRRGYVSCGTDLISKTYAYKDENGQWKGIDADICKLFSFMLFGHGNNIQMVHVPSTKAAQALNDGKIEIMLSAAPAQASQEIAGNTLPAAIIYYDRQKFLANIQDNATSMEDYQGQKICADGNSEDLAYLNEFNERYALDLKILPFPSFEKAKEAFLLNRCQLISGSEIQLLGILKSSTSKKRSIAILPEVIATKPVFAHVAKNNDFLRRQVKWVINAPLLAEHLKINSKNVTTFSGAKDKSTQNLLGVSPNLWQKFFLTPQGVKNALEVLGNYDEIYQRNLGADSPFKLERGESRLIENGGLMNYQLFL